MTLYLMVLIIFLHSVRHKTHSQQAVEAANGNAKNGTAVAPAPAAAEEIMMAQMLLTFSNVEQARFAAYTRSKLPTRAVQDWITALLQDKLRHQTSHRHASSLADLVSTDQANDIVWTIAMAAKIFAQRLVADAIKYSNNNINNQRSTVGGVENVDASGTSSSNNSTTTATTVGHPGPVAVWRAVQERRHHDDGLFLQKQPIGCLHWSGTEVSAHQQARLATEQAQEEYDQEHPLAVETPPDDNDNAAVVVDNEATTTTSTATTTTEPPVETTTEPPAVAMETEATMDC
jgi:hypothetical protein